MKESHLSPTLTPEEAESLFGPTRDVPSRRPRSPNPQPALEAAPAREIRAIETQYVGHRFRSRLEARWAVFFDHLGVEWLYESEGYRVGPPGRARGYLPDFHLPAQDLWVEVKGHAGALDAGQLLAAADPVHGLPRSLDPGDQEYGLWEPRILLLGQVPERPTAHDLLAVVGAQIVVQQFAIVVCGGRRHGIEPLMAPAIATPERLRDGTLAFRQKQFGLGLTLCSHACDAYTAARMARFEHGESGAPMTAEEGLTRFVETRCVRGDGHEVRLPVFRRAYATWCEARKVTAVSTKELTTELRRFGVTLSRGRRPRVYLGVALRESVPA